MRGGMEDRGSPEPVVSRVVSEESPGTGSFVVGVSLVPTGRFLATPCPPLSYDWRGCPGLGAVVFVVISIF